MPRTRRIGHVGATIRTYVYDLRSYVGPGPAASSDDGVVVDVTPPFFEYIPPELYCNRARCPERGVASFFTELALSIVVCLPTLPACVHVLCAEAERQEASRLSMDRPLTGQTGEAEPCRAESTHTHTQARQQLLVRWLVPSRNHSR